MLKKIDAKDFENEVLKNEKLYYYSNKKRQCNN